MIKYFHVDMWGKLSSGQEIELNNDKLSKFGENYFQKFDKFGVLEIGSQPPRNIDSLDSSSYREFFLEFFRKNDPELYDIPTYSRFNSFFAVRSIEDADRYIERSEFTGKAYIYEVFTESEGQLYDMTWLDQQFPKDYRKFGYYYSHYWKGLKIDNDPYLSSHEKRGSLMEALINKNVRIGDIVKVVNN